EELQLARLELKQQTDRAKVAAACLGSAVVALAIGLVFLLVAIAGGVAQLLGWPMWAGFMVVAVLLCLSGGVGLVTGRKRLQKVHVVPEETVRTLKENSAWIAKRLSYERR